MKEYSLFKTICLMVAAVPFVYVSGNGNETALRTALQTGYDQYSRPELPTNVSILYMLRTLQHLDITSETMKTTTLLRMDWTDSRLSWDTSLYGNITTITINWGWRPQFFIGNSADELQSFGTEDKETTLRIFSTGLVSWNIYFIAETECAVKTVNFPFDEQTCTVELGFLYHDYGVNLLPIMLLDKVDQSIYVEDGEWSLEGSAVDTTQFYQCCPELRPFTVNARMTFTRRQPYYIINIIMPIILLSFCVPWAFYITTESGERLGYALTMLLSYFVFLTVTSEMMPSTSLEIPVLAQYLLVVLLFCMIVLITVAIQVKLYFLESNPGLYARRVYHLVQMVMSFKCCKKKHKTPVRPLTAAPDLKLVLPKEDMKRRRSSSHTVSRCSCCNDNDSSSRGSQPKQRRPVRSRLPVAVARTGQSTPVSQGRPERSKIPIAVARAVQMSLSHNVSSISMVHQNSSDSDSEPELNFQQRRLTRNKTLSIPPEMHTSTEAMDKEDSDVDSDVIINAHSANVTGISGRNMFEDSISSPISNQIKKITAEKYLGKSIY